MKRNRLVSSNITRKQDTFLKNYAEKTKQSKSKIIQKLIERLMRENETKNT